MKRTRLLLAAAICLSLAVALLALTACGAGSGAVAATVNGTEIMEQEVTETIEAMRASSEDYSDDAAWAQALSMSSLTPESLRESVIEQKAQEIIVRQEAEAQGITVDEAAIDASIEETKTNTGAEDDAAWLEILQQYGYRDEQAYRDFLIYQDISNQLYEAFELEPTDEELIEFIAQNPTVVEGYTLPALEGSETATGEETTADTEGTEETATTEETEGTEGAEGTEGTDGTEGTEGTDGAETETVTVSPEEVDLAEIPEDILAQFTEQWLAVNKGTAFSEWITELVDSADIVINEMPADVSYNVDMSLAETDTGEGTEEEAATSDYSSAEAVESAIAEGLVITDDIVGDGAEATSGSTVSVYYTGTLDDGTVFDSNVDSGEPYSFVLGQGVVIRGWDAGVVGMKVGGTRTLTIPASLGYGSSGTGSIPADATLHFTVELVEVN